MAMEPCHTKTNSQVTTFIFGETLELNLSFLDMLQELTPTFSSINNERFIRLHLLRLHSLWITNLGGYLNAFLEWSTSISCTNMRVISYLARIESKSFKDVHSSKVKFYLFWFLWFCFWFFSSFRCSNTLNSLMGFCTYTL